MRIRFLICVISTMLILSLFVGCKVQPVDYDQGMEAWRACWLQTQYLDLTTNSALIQRLEDLRNQIRSMGADEWWRQRNDVYNALVSLREAKHSFDTQLARAGNTVDRESANDLYKATVKGIRTEEDARQAAPKIDQLVDIQKRLDRLNNIGLNPSSEAAKQIDTFDQQLASLSADEILQKLGRLEQLIERILAVQKALNERLGQLDSAAQRQQAADLQKEIEEANSNEDVDQIVRQFKQLFGGKVAIVPGPDNTSVSKATPGGVSQTQNSDQTGVVSPNPNISQDQIKSALSKEEELTVPGSQELGNPFESPFYKRYEIDIAPYGITESDGKAKIDAKCITREIRAKLQLKPDGEFSSIKGTKVLREYQLGLIQGAKETWTENEANVSMELVGVPENARVIMHSWHALPVPASNGKVIEGTTIDQTVGQFRLPAGRYYILGQGETDWGYGFDVMGAMTIKHPVE